MGPETPGPPVEPPTANVHVDLLERLLHDSYSVEGLSRMLRDQVAAERMRQQANVLAADLDDGQLLAFADHLVRLQRLNIGYINVPGFDSRDLPVISALQLYVSQSEAALEWLSKRMETEWSVSNKSAKGNSGGEL